MEVEGPEHTIRSWRDFLLHMGTVCLGILIAIGLEQSVEALHRRHERTELKERLMEEARSDHESIENDFAYIDTHLEWLNASMQGLDKATAARQPVVFLPLPTHYPGKPEVALYPDIPDSGAWNAAKQSGLVSLLSPRDQALDSYLYFGEEQTVQTWQKFDESLSALRVFWYHYVVAGSGGVPNLSHMTPEDAVTYRTLLAKSFESARYFRRALSFYAAANRVQLSGTGNYAGQITPALAQVQHDHPDKLPGLDDVSLNPAKNAQEKP